MIENSDNFFMTEFPVESGSAGTGRKDAGIKAAEGFA
jgi:hypothetical protein